MDRYDLLPTESLFKQASNHMIYLINANILVDALDHY